MGFMSRSVSLIRYRVRGEVSGPFWEAVDDGVRKGAFREVETSGEVVGLGWTSLEDFTDNLFEAASYVRGNYVALALRVDSLRIPPRILEMHFKAESRKLLEQRGQKRLSATQAGELKEQLKEGLKKNIFPSVQVFDLVWNTSSGVVYFGTHSTRVRERMEDHFKKCFGLTLIPLIPYIRAEEILGDASRRGLLEDLKPCYMIP